MKKKDNNNKKSLLIEMLLVVLLKINLQMPSKLVFLCHASFFENQSGQCIKIAEKKR